MMLHPSRGKSVPPSPGLPHQSTHWEQRAFPEILQSVVRAGVRSPVLLPGAAHCTGIAPLIERAELHHEPWSVARLQGGERSSRDTPAHWPLLWALGESIFYGGGRTGAVKLIIICGGGKTRASCISVKKSWEEREGGDVPISRAARAACPAKSPQSVSAPLPAAAAPAPPARGLWAAPGPPLSPHPR